VCGNVGVDDASVDILNIAVDIIIGVGHEQQQSVVPATRAERADLLWPRRDGRARSDGERRSGLPSVRMEMPCIDDDHRPANVVVADVQQLPTGGVPTGTQILRSAVDFTANASV